MIYIIFFGFVFISLIFVLGFLFVYLYHDFKGAPFVGCDPNVIREAFKLVKANNDDVVLDLGSGDGRALRIAINDFNVKKAIGYETSPLPIFIHYLLNHNKKIKLVKKSFYEWNPKNEMPTILYLYLLPKVLEKLTLQIKKAKKINPNLKIISLVFQIPEMEVKQTIKTYHRGFKKEVGIWLY